MSEFDQTADRTELGTETDGHGPRPGPVLDVGATLGRYQIGERLGYGSMGSVFAAHDPMLDRQVALKVLHSDPTGTRGVARMQREARAQARLSHPNVVTINDVGRSGNLVYIAMELVEGQTLRSWLGERTRDWPRVLEVMIQAGQGLVAAHEAGLVHRDFKPDNVMLASDGRVLLADFGIAWSAEESRGTETPSSETPAPGEEERGVLAARLTRTGALMGTPRYMAPEQFEGLEPDPRADQWAFCVVMWELLFGQHPVPGETVAEFALSVTSGELREPPAGHRVPLSIVRAIRQGLAADARQRHRSMDDLLAQLSRASRRRRPTGIAVAGIGVTLAALVGAVVVWPADDSDVAPCEAEAQMAEVWNETRAEAVGRAFDATSVALGPATKVRVLEGLGGYAQRWKDASFRVCADRGSSPIHPTADERSSCLGGRLVSLDHLVGLLERADDAMVPHAMEAVFELDAVEPCLDQVTEQAHAGSHRLALRRRAELIKAGIGDLWALRAVGRFDEALASVKRAEKDSVAIDHLPTQARIALARGSIEVMAATGDGGQSALLRAYELATGEGMDYVAARAAPKLARVHAGLIDRVQAQQWVRHAEAAVQRLSGHGLEQELSYTKAMLCGATGEPPDDVPGHGRSRCEQLHARAIEHAIEVFGPKSVKVASAHLLTGRFELVRTRYDRALEHLETARRIYTEALGAEHPRVAECLSVILSVQRALGDFDAARRTAEAVIPTLEAAYGTGHPMVLTAVTSEAIRLAAAGEPEQSLPLFDRALEGFVAVFGDNHPRVSVCLGNRSVALGMMGRHEDAVADLRRALVIAESTYEPMDTNLAVLEDNLGYALVQAGKPSEAVPLHEQAAVIWEARAPGLPSQATSHTDHARALLLDGRSAQAGPLLERAIAIFDAHAVDPAEGARARFVLARVLDAQGRDAARSVELAEAAMEQYGTAHSRERAKIKAWLAER
ncbi:MAG: tetratricopeptide repeat protein [Myxococcota bacterium]